jgi:hypothetical protein
MLGTRRRPQAAQRISSVDDDLDCRRLPKLAAKLLDCS